MRVVDTYRMATKIFTSTPLRTILTILGIGVSIGMILFLVSLGYGLQKITIESIATSETLYTLDVSTGKSAILKLDEQTLNKIKALKEVEKISPVVNSAGQIGYGGYFGDTLVSGVEKQFFPLEGINVIEGRILSSENEVVVSQAALNLFNLSKQQALGQEVSINIIGNIAPGAGATNQTQTLASKLVIVGITDNNESSMAYIPIKYLEDMTGKNYTSLKVKGANRENLISAKEQISAMGFSVTAVIETLDQTIRVFRIVKIVLALLGLVALLIASIGMFNTMTISLLERTRDIGIMKAVGIANVDVWRLFLAEASVIGFAGGLTGIVLGFTASKIFNAIVNLLAGAFGGEPVGLFYSPPWFLLLIIGVSVGVSTLTGVYPARRAARLDPIDALRYE